MLEYRYNRVWWIFIACTVNRLSSQADYERKRLAIDKYNLITSISEYPQQSTMDICIAYIVVYVLAMLQFKLSLKNNCTQVQCD